MINNKNTVKWDLNVEWITFLLCMQGIAGSNIGPETVFSEQDFSFFSQCSRQMPKLGCDHIRPKLFQLSIHVVLSLDTIA
jgi:hypothetical protein